MTYHRRLHEQSRRCRFNPPTVIVQTVHGGRYGKTEMQRNLYPKTLEHEWCGRHKPNHATRDEIV